MPGSAPASSSCRTTSCCLRPPLFSRMASCMAVQPRLLTWFTGTPAAMRIRTVNQSLLGGSGDGIGACCCAGFVQHAVGSAAHTDPCHRHSIDLKGNSAGQEKRAGEVSDAGSVSVDPLSQLTRGRSGGSGRPSAGRLRWCAPPRCRRGAVPGGYRSGPPRRP